MLPSTRLVLAFGWSGWIGVALAVIFTVAFVGTLLRMDGTSRRDAHAIGAAAGLLATVGWLMTTFG